MANLEDTIRSAVPGGSVGKPLMLALLALLASGALFKGSGSGSGAAAKPGAPSRPPATALAVCSRDWAGRSINCRLADWEASPIRGSVPGKINRSRRASSVPRLVLTCSRPSLSGRVSRRRSLPNSCCRCCRGSSTSLPPLAECRLWRNCHGHRKCRGHDVKGPLRFNHASRRTANER